MSESRRRNILKINSNGDYVIQQKNEGKVEDVSNHTDNEIHLREDTCTETQHAVRTFVNDRPPYVRRSRFQEYWSVIARTRMWSYDKILCLLVAVGVIYYMIGMNQQLNRFEEELKEEKQNRKQLEDSRLIEHQRFEEILKEERQSRKQLEEIHLSIVEMNQQLKSDLNSIEEELEEEKQNRKQLEDSRLKDYQRFEEILKEEKQNRKRLEDSRLKDYQRFEEILKEERHSRKQLEEIHLSMVEMNQQLSSNLNRIEKELKEERQSRKLLEEIRRKDNQIQVAGANWLTHCIAQEGGTRIRLLWGLFEIGYSNREKLNSCVSEYRDRFQQPLLLN